MIVQCPECHTRYRIDSSHIVEETTRFQCTKADCGHIFFYSPPLLEGVGRSSHDAEPPSASPPPSQFSIPENDLTIPSDDAHVAEEPTLTKPIEPFSEAPLDQPEIAATFEPSETPVEDRVETDKEEQHFADFSSPTWTESEETISPGTFLLFLGVLVLSFGVLGAYCFYHPTRTEAVLSHLPILNSLVAGERFSTQHIFLSNLEGHFELTKDNQKVFAVSGVATNNATIPARTIQLEGVIYDDTGKAVGKRLIFCGTNIAPERLVNLTIREIGALQDLVPPKQFHIEAGDSVKFLIVFTSPPSAVAEFSGRVVTAQFGRG